jgi:hypothetical protein
MAIIEQQPGLGWRQPHGAVRARLARLATNNGMRHRVCVHRFCVGCNGTEFEDDDLLNQIIDGEVDLDD